MLTIRTCKVFSHVLGESRYLRDSTNSYELGAVMELNVAGDTCTACCTRR